MSACHRPGDVVSPMAGGPIGNPDTIIANLKKWEEVGIDRMVFLINYDQTTPHKKILESLRRFGREVMPAFAEPATPPLTTLPDFAAEEVGLLARSATWHQPRLIMS